LRISSNESYQINDLLNELNFAFGMSNMPFIRRKATDNVRNKS
jgi:hypothetical protein